MRMTSSRRRPLRVLAWMNQIRHLILRRDCLLFCLSACLLTAVLGIFNTSAFAQKIQEQVQIARIDASVFPSVQVYTILRDRRGKPIPTGNLGNLTLTEKVLDHEEIVSDDLHQFTLNSVSTGAEVIFVIDVAGDLTQSGVKQDTYWTEMQNVVQYFIDTMKSEDKVGLVVVQGTQVDYLQPLTGDKALLIQSLEKIPQISERISFGRDGVDRALFELSVSPGYLTLAQAVVLMTPQLYHGNEGLDEIAAKAVKDQIPIHTVLTRDIEYSEASEPLINLSAHTGGTYVYYRDKPSPQPIFDSLNEQRVQTLLSFRSKTGDSSERTIEIKWIDVTGTFDASKTYLVALQPPTVKIISPMPDELITRQAESSEANLEQVEPTMLQVSASINWTDGFPREIVSAQLDADGNPVSNSFKISAEGISFDWDLRPYQEPGEKSVNLKIRFQDELGLTGNSDETAVKVQVSVPEAVSTATLPPQAATDTPTPTAQAAAPTIAPALCTGLAGFEAASCRAMALGKILVSTPSGWVTMGGLLFAIFAILMAFRFRGPISQARHKAMDTLLETVTQLRRLPQNDTGAFIQVLQGDEEFLGKSIPLYPDQVTSLGRSLRDVELAFQVNQERSVVSRRHCEIQGTKGRFKIIDLGSTHGTYLNGERLPVGGDGKILSHEDQIELGPAIQGGVLLQFRMPRSKADTGIEPPDSKPTYLGNL